MIKNIEQKKFFFNATMKSRKGKVYDTGIKKENKRNKNKIIKEKK